MREREGRDYYSRMDGLIRTVRTACDAIATRDAMAAKAAVATIRLVIPAGKATPQPPVGSALGQRGLNIMQFCKDFNDRTSTYEALVPVPVVITAFKDRSFTFVMKTPPVSYFLKKAAGITAGCALSARQRRSSHRQRRLRGLVRPIADDACVPCAHVPSGAQSPGQTSPGRSHCRLSTRSRASRRRTLALRTFRLRAWPNRSLGRRAPWGSRSGRPHRLLGQGRLRWERRRQARLSRNKRAKWSALLT